MWRFVLEVALAISVGVNVYLMTRHVESVPPPPVRVAEPRACPPPAAAAVVAPADASAPDASAPACPPAAKADCSAVEKQLADTEAKLEAHLPPAERYKHAGRALDVEARARELLDPIFAGLSKSAHAYDVECHGSVCKVSGADPALRMEAWMQEVQQHGGFDGWEFTGGDAYAVMATP